MAFRYAPNRRFPQITQTVSYFTQRTTRVGMLKVKKILGRYTLHLLLEVIYLDYARLMDKVG